MRVHLFVQNDWNKRPPRVANVVIYDSYKPGLGRIGDCWISRQAKSWMDAADRWWLVECANAEEGRLLIAQLAISESLRTVPGRVLASGGRR